MYVKSIYRPSKDGEWGTAIVHYVVPHTLQVPIVGCRMLVAANST